MTPDQIDNRLAYLGKAAAPVCRAAVSAGVKDLATRIKSAAPVAKNWRKVDGKLIAPGGMKQSIGWKVSSKNKVISARAGVDVGSSAKKKSIFGARHGHWYLLGTTLRYTGFLRVRVKGKTVDLRRTKSTIRYRGRMTPGVGFVRYTTSTSESAIWNVVIDKLAKGIEKAAVRQG